MLLLLLLSANKQKSQHYKPLALPMQMNHFALTSNIWAARSDNLMAIFYLMFYDDCIKIDIVIILTATSQAQSRSVHLSWLRQADLLIVCSR